MVGTAVSHEAARGRRLEDIVSLVGCSAKLL